MCESCNVVIIFFLCPSTSEAACWHSPQYTVRQALPIVDHVFTLMQRQEAEQQAASQGEEAARLRHRAEDLDNAARRLQVCVPQNSIESWNKLKHCGFL